MHNSQLTHRLLIVVMLFITTSIVAQAQSSVVYVTANRGTDLNTCSRTAPCRNIQKGVDTVAAGGTVVILDSGDYLPFTVNTAVSVEAAPGIAAIVLTTSGDGMTVSAANTDAVVLRGLTVTGLGGVNGITVTSVGNLYIEGCVISGFSNNGINFNSAAELFVKDTTIRNSGMIGIVVGTASGTVTATIDRCRVERSGKYGFSISNNARVSISNSVAANNGRNVFDGSGIYVTGTGAATVADSVASGNTRGFYIFNGGVMDVRHSTASYNLQLGYFVAAGGKMTVSNSVAAGGSDGGFAVNGGEMAIESCTARDGNHGMDSSNAGSFMRVSNSTLTGNIYGFYQSNGASLRSRGTNTIEGNTTNIFGTVDLFGGR
jgi:parallel beta-helix repeat protein